METKVRTVAMLRGSVREVMGGMVPIVQSAQSGEGLSNSQQLTKHRYIQWSCRYGVGKDTAGLSWLYVCVVHVCVGMIAMITVCVMKG